MNPTFRRFAFFAAFLWCSSFVHASGFVGLTTADQLQSSGAVFRGEVVSVQSYLDAIDNHVYTRTVVHVEEVFKGTFPALVALVHRGGEAEGIGEGNDFAPQFSVGQERLFFVSRRSNGTLGLTRGETSAPELSFAQTALQQLRAQTAGASLAGEDVTDQAAGIEAIGNAQPNDAPPFSAATNLISGPGTIGPRFLQQDRGEFIRYLVDVAHLDPALTVTQAVGAVQSALSAWASVTSLKFQFIGLQDFGTNAADAPSGDGVLRIQLHDFYKFTGAGNGDGVAVGGQGYVISTSPSGWTGGGNVIGNDFYAITSPWVVVQTTNAIFHDPINLAECLAHEIGHAIGLGHSSENPGEANPLLKQAIMYFTLHGDDRGAALNRWDTNVVQQLYPPFNTPPYAYGRFLDAVTTPDPINIPSVNSVQIPGFDLQTPTSNLVFQTADQSSLNGTFSSNGNTTTYVPNDFFGDTGRFDPTSGSFWDIIYARYSDGTNASPFVAVSVLSFNPDSFSEGIPDSFRINYFGSVDPSDGPNRHATDDFDGDGFNNLQEFLLGSDPTKPKSNLRITSFSKTNLQFQAKAYEVYELFNSTNLINWQLALNPLVPTTNICVVTNFPNGGTKQFYRVMKVP